MYFICLQVVQKNPLLQAEIERVEKHEAFPPLDSIRYQLPAPTAPGTDEEWESALDNAKAQLEHQRLRYEVAFDLTCYSLFQTRQLDFVADIWGQCMASAQLSA